MKTEINQTDKTKTNSVSEIMKGKINMNENNSETKNEKITTDVVDTNTASTAVTTNENTERLAQIVVKIRAAYEETTSHMGQVDDWKKKQLEAGLKMGRYLLEAKPLVRGKFIQWCRDNFRTFDHRTLIRYMDIAKDKNKAHVSNAGGLRQAYQACSNRGGATSPQEKGLGQIKEHLTKAKNSLNSYADLIACKDADAIGDLIDALNIWRDDYRARADRQLENKKRDSEFEESLGNSTKPSTKTNAESSLVE